MISLLLSRILEDYASTIVAPIAIFSLLLFIGIFKKRKGLILFNVVFHILAVINWGVMSYYELDYDPSFGLSGLQLIGPQFILGLIDLIILIAISVYLIMGNKKKKGDTTKVEETPVSTINCQHCGFPNPDNNEYCFKCGKNIK